MVTGYYEGQLYEMSIDSVKVRRVWYIMIMTQTSVANVHNSDPIWALWRLKSPVTYLLVQQIFVITSKGSKLCIIAVYEENQ